MKQNIKILLKQLSLKKDISKKYLNWMNDPEVQFYTKQSKIKHSIASIKNYVKEKNESKNEFMYGIFLKKNNFHIGNIKLGPIDRLNKKSEISYFIGEKDFWHKGVTTLAIKEILIIAKKKGLKKIKAACYEGNIGSKKVLKNNNFKIEGKFESELILNNKRCNLLWYGKVL